MLKSPIQQYEFIHELRASDLPKDVIHHAKRNLVDLIGVWAVGSRTKASQIARDHAARHYLSVHEPVAMAFDGRKVSLPGAAFAGATTIDAIDAHDGHETCKGHAGVALLPVLVGLTAHSDPSDLDAFLVTLVVGYEIAIRSGLSQHSMVADYHSSGSWNSIGCAAMGARIKGFDKEITRHAMGISEYFGPRAQMMRCIDHPTMVKDSSGWGAMVGANAILLAADGFTGAPALVCESEEVAHFWSDLGDRWRIRETNFKAHPVCRWAQPAIEACLEIVNEHQICAEQIADVHVTTFHEATRLNASPVLTCDQVQYHLPIPVALAVLHGRIAPDHLNENRLGDPVVLALAAKVRFSEKDGYNDAFPEQRLADVHITLQDGRSFQSAQHEARGNFDAPLSDGEVVEKFHAYCAGILSPDQIEMFAFLVTSENTNVPLTAITNPLLGNA